jgi:hypothetical protein
VSVDDEGLFTGKGIRELETIKDKGGNINYILINPKLSNKFGVCLAGADRSWRQWDAAVDQSTTQSTQSRLKGHEGIYYSPFVAFM